VYPYDRHTGFGVALSGSLSISSSGLSVTFKPGALLATETQYCVQMNGVVDLEGQPLAQNGSTLSCFTTGVSTQTVGPAVTAVSPGNGTTGVPVNATVSVSLSAPVSVVSVGPGAIVVTAGGQPVAGTVSVPNATTVQFTPSGSLAVSTAYAVTVGGFTDVAGNAVQAFTSRFTTGASAAPVTTGPTAVSVNAGQRGDGGGGDLERGDHLQRGDQSL